MKTVQSFARLGLALMLMMPVASAEDPMRDEMIDAMVFSPAVDGSLKDQKALVMSLEGRAVLIQSGSPVEKDLKAGDQIGIGDAVYTEKGAKVSISFDSKALNSVQLPADTRAVFTSIEPTDIKLENGTIFNAVDGLAQGSSWKVTTPSAVAAVRGTHFEVSYDAASGAFAAVTFNDSNTEKLSAIEVQSLGDNGGSVEVIEGKEMFLEQGEAPTLEKVQEVSVERANEGQKFMQEIGARREEMSTQDNSKNTSGGNGPGGPGGPGAGGGTSSGTTARTDSTNQPLGFVAGNPTSGAPSPMTGTAAMGSAMNIVGGGVVQDFQHSGGSMGDTAGMTMPGGGLDSSSTRFDEGPGATMNGPLGGSMGSGFDMGGIGSARDLPGGNLPPLDPTMDSPGATNFFRDPNNMICDSGGCHQVNPNCTGGTNC